MRGRGLVRAIETGAVAIVGFIAGVWCGVVLDSILRAFTEAFRH
jgi:hypothetical protein